MRFMQAVPDGGVDSGVTGFVLIEIKSLFSIMLLRFKPGGKRENFHSHAFNALTIWLSGAACEETLGGEVKTFPRQGRFKWTPRSLVHRYRPMRTSWCLTFRGPWSATWHEVSADESVIYTLTSPGRQVVGAKLVKEES